MEIRHVSPSGVTSRRDSLTQWEQEPGNGSASPFHLDVTRVHITAGRLQRGDIVLHWPWPMRRTDRLRKGSHGDRDW